MVDGHGGVGGENRCALHLFESARIAAIAVDPTRLKIARPSTETKDWNGHSPSPRPDTPVSITNASSNTEPHPSSS